MLFIGENLKVKKCQKRVSKGRFWIAPKIKKMIMREIQGKELNPFKKLLFLERDLQLPT